MQPDKTALRFLGHTTTWGELDERVTKLAGALQRRGVGPGDRVLILMLNRTEFIESFLAANRLGATRTALRSSTSATHACAADALLPNST